MLPVCNSYSAGEKGTIMGTPPPEFAPLLPKLTTEQRQEGFVIKEYLQSGAKWRALVQFVDDTMKVFDEKSEERS